MLVSWKMSVHSATKETGGRFALHNRLGRMVASQTGRLLRFPSLALQTNSISSRLECRLWERRALECTVASPARILVIDNSRVCTNIYYLASKSLTATKDSPRTSPCRSNSRNLCDMLTHPFLHTMGADYSFSKFSDLGRGQYGCHLLVSSVFFL
jgi:hypothetical protein